MFAGLLLLLDPQPTSAAHTPNNTTAARCFIEKPQRENSSGAQTESLPE